MSIFEGFIGESYTARSLAFDAQRSMNLYYEADQSGKGKSNAALLGTPGLALLQTLPTSPVRGIWTGLIDNLPGGSGSDLCAAVAGSKLYWVYQNGTVTTAGTAVTWLSGTQFSTTTSAGFIAAGSKIVIGGTTYTVSSVTNATSLTLTGSAGNQTAVPFAAYTQLGDVGTDTANSPCQFQVNGTQLLVSSAGFLWVWNNVTLQQAFFNDGTGTVDTVNAGGGTAVTWDSGSTFDASQVGSYILIAGTAYLISAFVDELHITLSTNAGTQAGATFYVLTGAGATPVYVQAAQTTFLDTYFVALPPGSKLYYISAINDGLNWNPLDFGLKAAFPDNIAAILADHEELWIWGSEATEVDQDTGGSATSSFPFQRNPGGIITQGCRAPFTVCSVANGVFWVGGTVQGNPIAWFAMGFSPQRVSTHAIEAAWGEYATITDALAYVTVRDGHQIVSIHFPTADATWEWDATAGTWNESGWWDGKTYDANYFPLMHRSRAAYHGYVFGIHLTGDWQTGALYRQSLDVFTDAGAAIARIRTAPHLSNEELWTFYARFRLAMQGGPKPTLQWSDDLGQTWNTPRAMSPRRISSTSDSASQVSECRRMGRARDRVYGTVITDPLQIAMTGAYLDTEGGGG